MAAIQPIPDYGQLFFERSIRAISIPYSGVLS